jgi:hypothetical protein
LASIVRWSGLTQFIWALGSLIPSPIQVHFVLTFGRLLIYPFWKEMKSTTTRSLWTDRHKHTHPRAHGISGYNVITCRLPLSIFLTIVSVSIQSLSCS